jgi:hypothetical protein
MRNFGIRLLATVLGTMTAATSLLASAAPAATVSGEQFAVAGKQTVVNEKAGTYEMSGGLLGDWKITSFTELAQKPVFKGKGTESFKGCVDRGLDGSCAGDPSGTLRFKFRYWAKFGKGDALELGTCAHPVTGGTGDFAGATGFLMMVDVPTKKAPGVETSYEGMITLSDSPGTARVNTVPGPC